jgi:glycerol kinase
MVETVLGIDQGTTSTRILALRDGEPPRILHSVRHRQSHPRPGFVEHDPEELVANLSACLDAAGPAAAIGMANQGESCLAWDSGTGEALSPVIVWQDNRTEEDLQTLRADHAEELTLSRAGLPLDPYFSASKLAWILKHYDSTRAALRGGTLRLGTTDAFFLDRLAGTFATDTTTASRTSLMNLATGAWDPDLCSLFGVPIECLPEIRPSKGSFGHIGGVPLTASLVDQQAALYGHGCRKPGDAKITFGTGAFALAVSGDTIVRSADRGLLPTVAWSDRLATTYAVDGGVYDAGAAVEWAMSLGIVQSVDELDDFASPSAISRGIVFVPALSGLACPYWDRSAAGLWIGMTASTTRLDLCQALLEGIALLTAEVIDAIDEHVPVVSAISIDGGLTRSHYFCQFLADILGRELVRPEFDELTAVGCAAMARESLENWAPYVPTGGASRFHPATLDRSAMRAKHMDAVARSRGWR